MAEVNPASREMAASTSGSGRGRPGAPQEKVYHTVTACRKTRCDTGLPRCDPCDRSNARCEYYDVSKNRIVLRAYITSLQSKIRQLQAELSTLEKEEKHVPDAEAMMRGAGMIKFSENDEFRYLGPSSGIAITRLVMELAKQNTANKSIREVVPDTTAREIKQKFDDESEKPTSKVYPAMSSVAAPHLPTVALMDRLVDTYMAKAQYMLPLLHEPTFREDIQTVYLGSTDATLNFQLRLVLAISMQKLDTFYAGLADSYYLAALPYLECAVRKRDLSTLQCLALIAQYSVLTPTRTASYWVVGLAARLCQELGLCDEATVKEWPPGTRLNTLEVDMRRRLYWIITSMEYGLAHSLGRPSAFGVTVDHIDVNFFELCDDRFITPAGLLPGHRPVMKKCISVHFFKMRLLQAEIRRTLYLKKRDTPVNDEDPWFHHMQWKLDEWVTTCPKNDEGSGLSEAWFHARRNTMIVFLYRPSPQVPEPSERAAEKCFDAGVRNIHMQSIQIAQGSVDLTWIFTQALFMALNTILWSLSYPAIRRQHPIEEVKMTLDTALQAINHTSDRWPGVQSAIQLYQNLIQGCLKAYSCDESYVVRSPPSARDEASLRSRTPSYSPASPLPPSLAASHTPGSRGESHGESSVDFQSAAHSSPDQTGFFRLPGDDQGLRRQLSAEQTRYEDMSQVLQPPFEDPPDPTQNNGQPSCSALPVAQDYGVPDFDPNSVMNEFPTIIPGLPHWDPSMTLDISQSAFAGYTDVEMDTRPWLGSFGDEYSRYMHQAFYQPPQRMQSLSEQQQLELMAALEQDQLPDVSNLMGDASTTYHGNIL